MQWAHLVSTFIVNYLLTWQLNGVGADGSVSLHTIRVFFLKSVAVLVKYVNEAVSMQQFWHTLESYQPSSKSLCRWFRIYFCEYLFSLAFKWGKKMATTYFSTSIWFSCCSSRLEKKEGKTALRKSGIDQLPGPTRFSRLTKSLFLKKKLQLARPHQGVCSEAADQGKYLSGKKTSPSKDTGRSACQRVASQIKDKQKKRGCPPLAGRWQTRRREKRKTNNESSLGKRES